MSLSKASKESLKVIMNSPYGKTEEICSSELGAVDSGSSTLPSASVNLNLKGDTSNTSTTLEKATVIKDFPTQLLPPTLNPEIPLVSNQKVNVIKQVLPISTVSQSEGKLGQSNSIITTTIPIRMISDSSEKTETSSVGPENVKSDSENENDQQGQSRPPEDSQVNNSSIEASESRTVIASLSSEMSVPTGMETVSLSEPQGSSQSHQALTQALAQPLRQSIIFHHGYDDLGLPIVHPTAVHPSLESMRSAGGSSSSATSASQQQSTELHEVKPMPGPPPVATATVIIFKSKFHSSEFNVNLS